jgi:NitT/TauT family transport system ATP-binding protein
MTHLLHLEDVYVRYTNPKGVEFTVLNDIDLKVSKGEFISVVGPSGCGKSTLLRLILGSEQPTKGTVLFHGEHIEKPGRNRGIVFQKYSLFPHLTVLENVIYGLDAEAVGFAEGIFRPLKRRKIRKAFLEEGMAYLEQVSLADSADKYPHQLSGGMQQRVSIAQSLIMKPSILLMDEPFGALDDSTRTEMQLFMLKCWHEVDMTVFFVTHDLEEACFLGSRILVLSQFYSSDNPNQEGSKIVTDIAVPGQHPKPTNYKYSKEMNALIEKIRFEGLNPHQKQHMKDFDLSHKDAFRTIDPADWRQE